MFQRVRVAGVVESLSGKMSLAPIGWAVAVAFALAFTLAFVSTAAFASADGVDGQDAVDGASVATTDSGDAVDYFCLTAEEAGSSVTLNWFSEEGDEPAKEQAWKISSDKMTWVDYTVGETIDLAQLGDKVYWCAKDGGNLTLGQEAAKYFQFSMSGKIAASGSIMTLLDPADSRRTLKNDGKYCFYKLFLNCTSLVSAPDLPATTVASSCYCHMFEGCTSLVSAPDLPATTLSAYCYMNMFYGCSSLTSMPLMGGGSDIAFDADCCCNSMFYGCTSLVVNNSSDGGSELKLSCSSVTGRGSASDMFTGCSEEGDYNTSNPAPTSESFVCYCASSGTAADTRPADGTANGQPFLAGTGGSENFRIPAMVTLEDGTIVAAADARWDSTGDGGGNDTVVARSEDDGATWDYTFANYLGDNGNVHNGASTCFIDPSLATDGTTVYMMVDLWPGGYALNSADNTPLAGANGFDESGNLRLSSDGRSTYGYYLNMDDLMLYTADGAQVTTLAVDGKFNVTGAFNGEAVNTNLFCADSPLQVYPTNYLYLTSSIDGGATWSDPSLVNVKKASEQTCLVGPGTGCVTSTGRIIYAVYNYTNGDKNASVIYSDDQGATWTRSADMSATSSEGTLTEVAVGDTHYLYLFTRHGGYYVSIDDGATWSACKNPGISYWTSCELNVMTYSKTIDGSPAILLSAPGSTTGRANGKIFVGLVQSDGSISWDYAYSVNSGTFQYSCLAELDDGSVSLLYEDGDASITYANLPISTIASGAVIGGSDDEETPDPSKRDITLLEGESIVLTDQTGNYEDAELEGLDEEVALVDLVGTEDSEAGASTEITFTGIMAGSTSVTIGSVRYNITVCALPLADAALEIDSISGAAYAEGAIAQVGEEIRYKITVTKPATDLDISYSSACVSSTAEEGGPVFEGTETNYQDIVFTDGNEADTQTYYMTYTVSEEDAGTTFVNEVCFACDYSVAGHESCDGAFDQLLSASISVAEDLVWSRGDVNGNGVVNIVDAQIVFDMANGVWTDLTSFDKLLTALSNGWNAWILTRAADANEDGVIASGDARAIQHYCHTNKWSAK